MSSPKVDRLFKLDTVKTVPKPKRNLFQRMMTRREPSMTQEEAFVALLIGCSRADGSVSPEETQEIAALCSRTQTLSSLSQGQISEIQRRIDDRFNKEGQDKVLGAACQTILHESDSKPDITRAKAESIFAHVVDVAFADRELHEDEQLYIEQLSELLEIPEPRVRAIAEVIELKNMF